MGDNAAGLQVVRSALDGDDLSAAMIRAGNATVDWPLVERAVLRERPDAGPALAELRNGHPVTGSRFEVHPQRSDDSSPPPTLAETWEEHLHAHFLNPKRFILRLATAGLGGSLDRILGGGLTLHQTVAFVSAGAGVGKTAYLHQLADGIAEANAAEYVHALEHGRDPVVVPVLFVSEMTTGDLTLRGLARQAGVEGYLLRDPRGERGSRPFTDGLTYGEDALRRARAAAGAFQEAARFLTIVDKRTTTTVADLEEAVRRIRRAWEDAACIVSAVVVIIDPIHRLIDPTRSEVEGLGHLLPAINGLAHRQDAIVLYSSDTTKLAAASRSSVSAKERADELADAIEAAFRGSYQLLHLPDFALGLITVRSDDESLPESERARLSFEPKGTLYAEIGSAKSRWESRGLRAAYLFDPALFRFRATAPRTLSGERSVRNRILDFIAGNTSCSEHKVKKGVTGARDATKVEIIRDLIGEGLVVDEGTKASGMRLRIAEKPDGPKVGTTLGTCSEGAIR
jgi:hypothetical protein